MSVSITTFRGDAVPEAAVGAGVFGTEAEHPSIVTARNTNPIPPTN